MSRPAPPHPDKRWKVNAACTDVDLSLFFPEDDEGNSIEDFVLRDEEGNPGRYCFHCPVQQECLNYAIELRMYDGIYGGMNESARRVLINRSVKLKRDTARDARNARKNNTD